MENDQENSQGATQPENPKVTEYIKELIKEKNSLDPGTCPNAMRLLEDEVVKTQAKGKPLKDSKYVDIYREKPVRVAVKVLVPVKEHPRFNFVGKLLGPKGNSLKRLQEETMTRMAILGRGSMRDKQKEEEWRNTLDPKYSHLSEDLHVEITALAAPAEAHARIAFALAELRKYLVPDSNDEIRLEQLREIQAVGGGIRGAPDRRPPPPPPARPPRGPPPPRAAPGGGKAKVLSILDRARAAMEEPYGEYEEPYYEPAPPVPQVPPTAYGGDYNGQGDYYDTPSYTGGSVPGRWKGFKTSVTGRGYGAGSSRPGPYSRSAK